MNAIPNPPVPESTASPRSWLRPSNQPLRMSGNVTQFGTLSAQPSMNAARIIPAQTTTSGPPLSPAGWIAAQIWWATIAARNQPTARSGMRAIWIANARSMPSESSVVVGVVCGTRVESFSSHQFVTSEANG